MCKFRSYILTKDTVHARVLERFDPVAGDAVNDEGLGSPRAIEAHADVVDFVVMLTTQPEPLTAEQLAAIRDAMSEPKWPPPQPMTNAERQHAEEAMRQLGQQAGAKLDRDIAQALYERRRQAASLPPTRDFFIVEHPVDEPPPPPLHAIDDEPTTDVPSAHQAPTPVCELNVPGCRFDLDFDRRLANPKLVQLATIFFNQHLICPKLFDAVINAHPRPLCR